MMSGSKSTLKNTYERSERAIELLYKKQIPGGEFLVESQYRKGH